MFRRPPSPLSLVPLLAVAALLCGPGRARADDPPPGDPPPGNPAPTDPVPPGPHAGTPPSPAPDPGDDDGGAAAALTERVKASVDKGVRWLKQQQFPNGSFGDLGVTGKSYTGSSDLYQYPIGPTALALFALLKCDVPTSDDVVKRGFAWLKKAWKDRRTPYEHGMLLLAIAATADPNKQTAESVASGDKVRLTGEWRAWAIDVRTALLAQRAPRGWRYWKDVAMPGGPEDVSSTQLALLALNQAERVGIPIDPNVWADAISYVLTLQERDGPDTPRAVHVRPARGTSGRAPPPPAAMDGGTGGTPAAAPPTDRARGFAYSVHATASAEERQATGARTACGTGSLLIAKYSLETSTAKDAAKVAERVDGKAVEQAAMDGLAWLAKNWSPWANPKGAPEETYYLYCVERVMDLLRVARLGERLWYSEMAEALLGRQGAKGFWDVDGDMSGARGPAIQTSLALLFLHRATGTDLLAPVLTQSGDAGATDGR